MKETVKMKTRFAILLAAVMCMTLAAGAQPTKRDVDLPAADGAKLKASYYSPGRPGPGVLLLHQCNRDRASWEGLAAQLVERGIHVVTLDYRGYGESGGERYTTDAGRAALRANWFSDVDIALAYLISQSGVDKSRLGAGGASCGVNQSIQLARRNPAVKSLALLSGSTNEEGAEFLRGSRNVVILFSAAADDRNALPTMKQMAAAAPNPANKFAEFEKGGHGVEMFAAHPDLMKTVADWYRQTLR